MSTSLSLIGKQISVYCGIPVFIAGVLGGLLNTIVFLSLRTFRQSSCAFFLTIMSIFNVGQLFAGLLSRIMINASGIDGTETSLFYCKFRSSFLQLCGGISLTCLCLATIDQYCTTCTRLRWQQWWNIKHAQYLVIITIIIWTLHGIPFVVFYDHILSPTTNKTTCSSKNSNFSQYNIYVVLIISGIVPVIIAFIFGCLAYYNIKQLAYRTIPLVRRELDKQLSNMVLLQVLVNIFTLLPFNIVNMFLTNIIIINDSIIRTNFQFASNITLIIYYAYFASPFYIYICASERFRKQLIHVLFKLHYNQWRRLRIFNNQLAPET